MMCMDIQEVTSRSFMPISECPSARCRTNNTKGRLCLQVRGSKFTKFQEVRSAPFHLPVWTTIQNLWNLKVLLGQVHSSEELMPLHTYKFFVAVKFILNDSPRLLGILLFDRPRFRNLQIKCQKVTSRVLWQYRFMVNLPGRFVLHLFLGSVKRKDISEWSHIFNVGVGEFHEMDHKYDLVDEMLYI